MPGSRALRVAVTLAAGVAVAVTAAGVTYAATTSTTTKVVHACANRAGTLRLLNKGKCPAHYRKVAINRQGPRGLTGPRGPQGPGAIGLTATQADATPKESPTIGHTGLTVSAGCTGATESFVYVTQPAKDLGNSAPAWTVSGSSQLANNATALVLHDPGPTLDAVAGGPSLIEISQPDGTASVEFLFEGNGLHTANDWYVDLLVTRNHHVFALHAALHVDGTACSTRLVATPAG
jgi:hypothetical protein